jgi:molybdenum cofactor synthesis domain-containing protein
VENYDLLNKTELRVERIELQGANLNDVAAVVAETLGLDRHEVLVTDVLDDVLAIDVLREDVDVYRLVGKKELLLGRLSLLPGLRVTAETSICSTGILGWIALDESKANDALKRSEAMAAEIRRRMAKRAIVFSTGFEVNTGQIEDTNKPTVCKRLETEGFAVTPGPTLKDDREYIAGCLRQAVHEGGYGLIVTTGGVGAEFKDHTIEALLALDPQAAAPYICRFEKGTGRHVKDGVRIGVAQVSETLIVALPGPNDEVRRSLEVLVRGLASKLGKYELAEEMAVVLRNDLRAKMKHT